MKTVYLKNNSEEAASLVNVMMVSLCLLFDEDPIVFYELVMLARDQQHNLFGNTGDKLKDLHLIQRDNRMHTSLRNIVLSAVAGDGLEMTLGDPRDQERNTNG